MPALQALTLAVCSDINAQYEEDPAGLTAALAAAIDSCGEGLDIRPPILIE